MPVINSVTNSSDSCSLRRFSSPSCVPTAPTRIAKRISGSMSPIVVLVWPATAPIRFLGMNISTIAAKFMSGEAAPVAMCFCAAPPNSCNSRVLAAASSRLPGCTTFIISRPRPTPIAMFRKKRTKVRLARGPSRSSRPSCTTPPASDANTSGTTTKKSIRRKICPNGSNTAVLNARACSTRECGARPKGSAKTGSAGLRAMVAIPAMTPTTSPSRMRLARGRFDSAMLGPQPAGPRKGCPMGSASRRFVTIDRPRESPPSGGPTPP